MLLLKSVHVLRVDFLVGILKMGSFWTDDGSNTMRCTICFQSLFRRGTLWSCAAR